MLPKESSKKPKETRKKRNAVERSRLVCEFAAR
jgi:hypothetical protein